METGATVVVTGGALATVVAIALASNLVTTVIAVMFDGKLAHTQPHGVLKSKSHAPKNVFGMFHSTIKFKDAAMCLSTIAKLFADKFQNVMTFKFSKLANGPSVNHNADMFQNTTGNMFAVTHATVHLLAAPSCS